MTTPATSRDQKRAPIDDLSPILNSTPVDHERRAPAGMRPRYRRGPTIRATIARNSSSVKGLLRTGAWTPRRKPRYSSALLCRVMKTTRLAMTGSRRSTSR
jgi:hypothetical protein